MVFASVSHPQRYRYRCIDTLNFSFYFFFLQWIFIIVLFQCSLDLIAWLIIIIINRYIDASIDRARKK